MITLYHSPRSRSVRPRWLLKEAGATYELVAVDIANVDIANKDRSAPHRTVHPHGQVPALVDGDLARIESAAICLHLADKFADAKLAPPIGTPARARYYRWMVYAIGTLEPPILDVFMNTVQLPAAERSAEKAAAGRSRFGEVGAVIAGGLAGGPYLLGEQFSAADVMIGSTLAWAPFLGLLDGQPVLGTYVERLLQRPAYQRAQAD
jgi:glutathione S-transferase